MSAIFLIPFIQTFEGEMEKGEEAKTEIDNSTSSESNKPHSLRMSHALFILTHSVVSLHSI